MKRTMMRWSKSLDHRVLGRRLAIGLETLLQHRLWIGGRSGNGIRATQFLAQRGFDKLRSSLQATVQKDRAHHRFKNIREQGSLAAAAALLFTTTEANELAEAEFPGRFGQGW